MKKAVVIDVFSFVGFSLTNLLLNKGVEVVGVVLENQNHNFEQKLAYIGRNANFTYINEEDLLLKNSLKDVDVYYFCQGLLREKTESDRQNTKYILNVIMQLDKLIDSKIVYLTSIDIFSEDKLEIDETTSPNLDYVKISYDVMEEMEFVKHAKEKKIPYIIIRVPTVYGPWQPDSYVYQQCIHHIIYQTKSFIVINESTADILFIEDMVEALYSAGSKNIQNEIIHLSSGEKNLWVKGVQLLIRDNENIIQLKEEIGKSVIYKNEKAKRLLDFNPKTTVAQGIEKQMRHSLFLHGMNGT